MNTANLQLEGLYVAVTALAEALREKGLLSAEEIGRSLERAEGVAARAAGEKDISDSNLEAIVFPIRYLRVAVEAASRGQHLPFHEVARRVGESRQGRPGSQIRRDDELRTAAPYDAKGGGEADSESSQSFAPDELLTMARLQEHERDA